MRSTFRGLSLVLLLGLAGRGLAQDNSTSTTPDTATATDSPDPMQTSTQPPNAANTLPDPYSDPTFGPQATTTAPIIISTTLSGSGTSSAADAAYTAIPTGATQFPSQCDANCANVAQVIVNCNSQAGAAANIADGCQCSLTTEQQYLNCARCANSVNGDAASGDYQILLDMYLARCSAVSMTPALETLPVTGTQNVTGTMTSTTSATSAASTNSKAAAPTRLASAGLVGTLGGAILAALAAA